MANFPESLDTFADRTGASYVASTDPNTIAEMTEVTQAFIGALGEPSSWSTTLLQLLRKMRRDLFVYIESGDVKVKIGQAMLENTDGTKFAFKRNASDTTLSTSNLDVGAMEATFYYVYAVSPTAGTTAAIQFSTDMNAPASIGTAPYYRLGWFYNAAAAALTPTHCGNFLDNPGGGSALAMVQPILNQSTAAAALEDWPGMEIPFISSNSRRLRIHLDALLVSDAGRQVAIAVEEDGSVLKQWTPYIEGSTSGVHGRQEFSFDYITPINDGAHIYKIQWADPDGGVIHNFAAASTAPPCFSVEQI